MLRRFHLHLDSDEKHQAELEAEMSLSINKTYSRNTNALRRYAPLVLETLKKGTHAQHSIFCNKLGKPNIVDLSRGRTLYDLDPDTEIEREYQLFHRDSGQYEIDDEGINFSDPRPNISNEVIAVLGVGIGYHLEQIIDKCSVNHLVLYEQNIDFFKCSMYATRWDLILAKAKQLDINIYFVIGNNELNFGSDVSELHSTFSVRSISIYRHLNSNNFNALISLDSKLSFDEIDLQIKTQQLNKHPNDFYSRWNSVCDPQLYAEGITESKCFDQNLDAFKHYFPDIFKRFKTYKPERWKPRHSADGRVNIYNELNSLYLYGENPKEECETSITGFASQPHKDGLILGYEGKKLKSYLHYQFVKKVESALEGITETSGHMPKNIKSMIIFGLGIGHQLDYLYQNFSIEKLFICEPNADLFYASLFVIDWAGILKKVDEDDSRLYINIGATGSDLMNDLMAQFYAAGPYVLANTYVYQGYYNDQLENAISQVREQLRVIISLGDYFDHARFGISHTLQTIEDSCPFLVKGAKQKIPYGIKEVPVFLVGNGPSLDFLMPTLKEHAENAIVVSCGTSLQVLYKNGIVPDFHAEIEQNRATFDWTSKIKDFEFLKKITLISTNGMHPDTCNLFKETWLTFKDGESSTVSLSEILGRNTFETLDCAFPTVSNFALDLFVTLGFSQIYLWGIDLGFIDVEHHHSKDSGYFNNDGEQLLNFAENENVYISVQGNFRSFVHTKYEFKFSISVLEQALARGNVDCYNLNDGARIANTQPLHFDTLLTAELETTKSDVLSIIKKHAFMAIPTGSFFNKYSQRFSHSFLKKEFSELHDFVTEEYDSVHAFEKMIDEQKQRLIDSLKKGQSLTFYLLYGTVNYVNSVMTKVLFAASDDNLERLKEIQTVWSDVLAKMVNELTNEFNAFDCISSYGKGRHIAFMNRYLNQTHISVNRTDKHNNYADAYRFYNVTFNDNTNSKSQVVKRIAWIQEAPDETEVDLAIVDRKDMIFLESLIEKRCQFLYLPGEMNLESDSLVSNDVFRATISLIVVGSSSKIVCFLPKLVVSSMETVNRYYRDVFDSLLAGFIAYDFGRAIGFSRKPLDNEELLLNDGTRGQRHEPEQSLESFVARMLHNDELEDYKHKKKLKDKSLSE